jgi:uncharacterized protein YndB with AHSA1/START domain
VSRVERLITTTPEHVWDVLMDGWLYPLWVVGATRMREVDTSWPDVGARLHHSVGTWPLVVDDTTSVVACTPPSMLALRARAWPGGEADVVLHLEPVGADTRVSIEEEVASGPAVLIPRPVRELGLRWRNVETLRRLAYVAERRNAG